MTIIGTNGLSRRELETLHHLLKGRSEKEVAHAMGLSRNTVHVYVKAVYRKAQVNSRAELLVNYFTGEVAGGPVV